MVSIQLLDHINFLIQNLKRKDLGLWLKSYHSGGGQMESSKTAPSFLAKIVNEKYYILEERKSITIKNLNDIRMVVLLVSSFNLPVRPL